MIPEVAPIEILELEVLHNPPETVSVRVDEAPMHTVSIPIITPVEGSGDIVILL